MAEIAWACRIIRENQAAIASENPRYDKDIFEKWLEDHGSAGFFVRDPGSPFDCKYMSDMVFERMYIFESGDEAALFRRILRTP